MFLKKSNKLILFIACFVTSVIQINAQQDPQYTMYMFNTMSVNSAYAGTNDHALISGLHRSQWVGLDGAPSTQTLSFDTPINKRVGIGFSVVNDEIGPSNEVLLDGNFSYKIPLTAKTKLSFGIKAGARLLNVDFTKGATASSLDSAFENNIDNQFMPTIGVGALLYTNSSYLGLSIPNFIETEYYDADTGLIAEERFHVFLIGGYVFDLKRNIKFKPAFLTKLVEGAPLSVDLSGSLYFNDKVHVGISYRWDDSVSAIVGIHITKQLMVAYAYDLTTTDLGNYNNGSHEIILQYRFFKNKTKFRSPRYF